MSDEFGHTYGNLLTAPSAARSKALVPVVRSSPVPRLVVRLYRSAGNLLRARMLGCLLRPLSSLGLAAVASGAFAVFLQREVTREAGVPFDDLGRFTNEQIFELAQFVEQVSPDAIQSVAELLATAPVGVGAFTVSVAVLLGQAVRSKWESRVHLRPRRRSHDGASRR